MSLTIAFITSRDNPKFQWFLDSLYRQGRDFNIIIVDAFASKRNVPGYQMAEIEDEWPSGVIRITEPKPNIWQGPHRLTGSDWWAKSNALNTSLCYCKTDWFASVDDRCVLDHGWYSAVRSAMASNYAVCGSYEKRVNMVVENGEIVEPGTIVGFDHRCDGHPHRAKKCAPGWFFGCSFALPTEWALQVNGWNEYLDGLSAEDTHFGHMLANNGFDIRFNPEMKVIQDRTPGECGPEMKRSSKERFQHDTEDKGHAAIRRFFGEKQSSHPWNIRELRASVLSGDPFPLPDVMPRLDWFDSKPIAEFE